MTNPNPKTKERPMRMSTRRQLQERHNTAVRERHERARAAGYLKPTDGLTEGEVVAGCVAWQVVRYYDESVRRVLNHEPVRPDEVVLYATARGALIDAKRFARSGPVDMTNPPYALVSIQLVTVRDGEVVRAGMEDRARSALGAKWRAPVSSIDLWTERHDTWADTKHRLDPSLQDEWWTALTEEGFIPTHGDAELDYRLRSITSAH